MEAFEVSALLLNGRYPLNARTGMIDVRGNSDGASDARLIDLEESPARRSDS